MHYGILSGTEVRRNPDGLGILPLLIPLVGLYTTYRAGKYVFGGGSTTASTDPIQSQVDAFKACGNQLAVRAGYRAVPAGPLLGKTCGLANDPISSGCPNRDYLISTCRSRGITPEGLVQMTLEEAQAAKAATPEEAEEEKPFLRTRTALYLGLAAVGAVVYLSTRKRRSSMSKNPPRRRYYTEYAMQLARNVLWNHPTPYELTKGYGLTLRQAQQIVDASSGYGGPGGKTEAEFARYVDRVLRPSRGKR